MRVIAASLFILIGMAMVGTMAELMVPDRVPKVLVFATMTFLDVVIFLAAYRLFNRREFFDKGAVQAEALKKQGLLSTQEFHAVRAVKVHECADEGPHYLIELADRDVLYMNGQYLYEYEEDPEESGYVRRFPCTEFTVRRHKRDGWVLDIQCSGMPFEPELNTSWKPKAQRLIGKIPWDGQILQHVRYDELKRAFE